MVESNVESAKNGGVAGEQGRARKRGTPAAPVLGAVGIGVTDLDRSYAFYTEVMGMQLGYELKVPGYADEKIMVFEGGKGSSVVLMDYTDGVERNYRNNPVKLVFYVPDAGGLLERLSAAGYPLVEPAQPRPAFGNAIVGFGRDPDGYLIEVVENAELTTGYMAAVGIGVSDLEASKAFYERTFAMQALGGLIQVKNRWDEFILRHSGKAGTSIVPMHWTDGSNPSYRNVPVKLVHFLPDMRAITEQIRGEGLKVLSEPSKYNVQGNDVLIALVRDPDGYVLELVSPLSAEA